METQEDQVYHCAVGITTNLLSCHFYHLLQGNVCSYNYCVLVCVCLSVSVCVCTCVSLCITMWRPTSVYSCVRFPTVVCVLETAFYIISGCPTVLQLYLQLKIMVDLILFHSLSLPFTLFRLSLFLFLLAFASYCLSLLIFFLFLLSLSHYLALFLSQNSLQCTFVSIAYSRTGSFPEQT